MARSPPRPASWRSSRTPRSSSGSPPCAGSGPGRWRCCSSSGSRARTCCPRPTTASARGSPACAAHRSSLLRKSCSPMASAGGRIAPSRAGICGECSTSSRGARLPPPRRCSSGIRDARRDRVDANDRVVRLDQGTLVPQERRGSFGVEPDVLVRGADEELRDRGNVRVDGVPVCGDRPPRHVHALGPLANDVDRRETGTRRERNRLQVGLLSGRELDPERLDHGDQRDAGERLARLDVEVLLPALVLVDPRSHRPLRADIDLVLPDEGAVLALGPLPALLLQLRFEPEHGTLDGRAPVREIVARFDMQQATLDPLRVVAVRDRRPGFRVDQRGERLRIPLPRMRSHREQDGEHGTGHPGKLRTHAIGGYARSNSSTSAGSALCKLRTRSPLTAAPSPADSFSPFRSIAPRATCTHACRPDAGSNETRSPWPSNAPYTRASWLMVTDPSRPSREASSRSLPLRSSTGKVFCSYPEFRPRRSGTIQICRKCTGSVSEALNSLCATPLPALMRCTSPGRITPPPPEESR